MIAKIELAEQQAFYVLGISVRTTNQNNQSQKDIGELWGRFMQENVLRQIPDRISDDIYSVYTNYESDYTEPYTTIIGCKVSSLDNVPAGFTGLLIPQSDYREYTLTGKLPGKIYDAWQQIWSSDVDRSYTADYDRYSVNAENFEDSDVKIYLAVK